MNRLGHYVLQYCLIIGAWLLVIPLFIGYCVLIITGSVIAENLSVSLRVGLSSFTVSGYTSPLAMVTIKQNGVTAGTTSAGTGGTFSKTIQALEPATYAFQISSTDSKGKISNSVEYVVAIGENQDLLLDNLLLPPTLSLDTLDTSVGTDIHLHGEAYPGATIRLFLADILMATYPVEASGRWYGLISTTGRASGEYHVYAHASHLDGYQSIPSIGHILTLRAPGTLSPSPSTTPNSPIPQAPVTDPTALITPILDDLAPTLTPSPSDLPEDSMIRLILVRSNNMLVILLFILVLLLLFLYYFLMRKHRRKQKDQNSTTTSPS